MRRLAVIAFGAFALSNPAPAFSDRELVELCPVVGIAKDAKTHAVYPGGAPGRSAKEFNHIAVILAAAATCREDEDGNMLADVTVQYALETGSLYRGSAETTVFAAVTRSGAESQRLTSTKIEKPDGLGTQITVTDTVRGVLIGDDDAAEAPDLSIMVGFAK